MPKAIPDDNMTIITGTIVEIDLMTTFISHNSPSKFQEPFKVPILCGITLVDQWQQ